MPLLLPFAATPHQPVKPLTQACMVSHACLFTQGAVWMHMELNLQGYVSKLMMPTDLQTWA